MYQQPAVIGKVGELLREPINRKNVLELERMRFELAEATASHLKFLYEKRKQLLWPKDMEKGLTELDRTTRLNGDLAPIESDYELLKKVEMLVSERIALYMTEPGKLKPGLDG